MFGYGLLPYSFTPGSPTLLSDGNGSRTRSDLIDNQAPFPEETATENIHQGD